MTREADLKRRVDWIDTAKFWGMLFIYIGHFGPDAGLINPWVWKFHVMLFFFLSGCVENFNHRGFLENLKHKAVYTLLPFYFFGLISVLYALIRDNSIQVLQNGIRVILLGGVRNSIEYGVGLWFLSCLFVVQVLFSIIKKIKYKTAVLVICFGLHLLAIYVIDPPKWYYNVDSAFDFIIFYCLGWILYPLIDRTLNSRRPRVRIIRAVVTAGCLIYTGYLYLGRNLLAPLFNLHPAMEAVQGLIMPMANFWVVIVISYLFPAELLKQIGRHSLYMCGNEFIVRNLVTQILAFFGVTYTITSPVQTCLYCFGLLILADKVLVPVEKPMLVKLQNMFTKRTPDHGYGSSLIG